MRSRIITILFSVAVFIGIYLSLHQRGLLNFTEALRPEFKPGVARLEAADLCGQKEFWLKPGDFSKAQARSEITVSKCGFAPALTRIDRFFGFSIRNQLAQPADIQILIFQPDGQKRGFDRILKPNERLDLHRGNFSIGEKESVMILSRATPAAGISALVPNDQEDLLKVTSTPPEMIVIDPETGQIRRAK
jgi:hypothetical protein